MTNSFSHRFTAQSHRTKFVRSRYTALLALTAAVGLYARLLAQEPTAAPKEESPKIPEIKLSEEAVKRYGITTAPVARQVLTPTFTASARVAFNTDEMAHVGAVVRGRAVELKVRRGDLVKKGDQLVVVESSELGEAQSDLLQKRTAAEIARPAADLAKDAYERAKKLLDESQGIALTEVQKRQSEYQAAAGVSKAAEATVSAAENRLHLLGMDQAAVESLVKTGEINPRYTITAPMSGQVTQREVTLGELVSPDKEAILIIANTEVLWVLADVPEALLGQVKVGSKARVTVAAAGVAPFEGKVSFIDLALDPNTRTARVRIEVNGTDARSVRPGMFAQAELSALAEHGNQDSVLVVPDEAVQTVDGVTAVFVPVAGEANTFIKRDVKLGDAVGGLHPVQSGLKEGEQVVISGSFQMKAELGKGSADED